jgi:Ca-activated chloride channel family protein
MLWPASIFLLGLIPLLIALYVWVLRRRKRFTVRYSSLSLVRDALPKYSRWRRHFPFALFLFALASLVISLGRPIAIMAVPTNQTTIMLSMDVSRSMCSTDIPPNRLVAAQAAAVSFIESQKAGSHIGVVAFSSFAELVRLPTTDKETLITAINSLLTGRGTAIGSGILKALDTIADIDSGVAPVTQGTSGINPAPVPKGAYAPAIIVLLTDGVSNVGPMPLEAAQQAADRGIRVYTIGFGTSTPGEFPRCGQRFMGREFSNGGQQFGGGQFGGGGGGGGNPNGFRRGIDEETLKQVAEMTGGEYYSAESSTELQTVFQNLPTNIIVKHEVMEISVLFTAIGALLAMLAIMLSMSWHPLP